MWPITESACSDISRPLIHFCAKLNTVNLQPGIEEMYETCEHVSSREFRGNSLNSGVGNVILTKFESLKGAS